LLNRRRFLRSLSRTALVLPFADIVTLAAQALQQTPAVPPKIGAQERDYEAKPAPPPPGPKSPIEGTSLGLSFVDVMQESGLNVKTIYGGELTNKYLLETTGCGLAFYDYDDDG
jgi:enediyne biosynthesis protein E4